MMVIMKWMNMMKFKNVDEYFLVAKVCRKFTELLVEVRQPMRGIIPLRTAIAALSDDSKQLTPLHTGIYFLFISSCLII